MNYAYSLLGSEPRPGHDVLKRSGPSLSRVKAWSFYGMAAIFGIITQTLIFTSQSSHLFRLAGSRCSELPFGPKYVPSLVDEAYTRPGLGQYVAPYEDRWSLGALRDMVSRTKGYYARDYSVWLGWNNMRYIVESAALHAKLLDRTLIIPSFVYAKSCEGKIELCAMYATMVLGNTGMHEDKWNAQLPNEKRRWKIPIQAMLDLDALRRRVPVVTVAQYLQLHGIPETVEVSDGHWDFEAYHSHSNSSMTSPSLAVIPNYDYDRNLSISRVDRLPERQIKLPQVRSTEWGVYQDLLDRIGFQATLNTEVARQFLKQKNTSEEWHSASEMVEIASKYGFAVVYTYDGQPSIFSKAVNHPVAELVPAATMRGFVNDYGHSTEDVLLLQGEMHSDRKPGFMTFTSPAARDSYTDMVLRGIKHLPSIQLVADAIAERMRELNDGRMWMAAHWRRGDFVRLGWNKGTPKEAIDHILLRFVEGTQRLSRLRDEEGFRPPSAPDVELDQSFENASLPLVGDKWYLATDERDPEALAIARAKNATLFYDLIESTPQLRRWIGWPMLFIDILALVEQEIMARSAFFSAYAHSSVSGGVADLRTERGMDPRTMILDGI